MDVVPPPIAFIHQYLWILVILALWELVWKVIALWQAARRKDMVWFLVIFIVNSIGILPIIYILLTSKKHR